MITKRFSHDLRFLLPVRAAVSLVVLFAVGLNVELSNCDAQEASVAPVSPATQVKQPIVLRNLTVLRNVSITSFDDQAILLSDGSTLGWDRILQASVEPDQQVAFDQKVKALGLPIYRLKRRVQNLDWSAAQEVAQPIYEEWIAKSQTTPGESAFANQEIQYLVHLSMMRGSLSRGNRAAAVWPFLQAAAIQSGLSKKFTSTFADAMLPPADVESQLSNDLLPVWFEKSEAQVAFDFLSTSYVANAQQKPQGPIVYLASLAIKAEKLTYARKLIGLLDQTDPAIRPWHSILSAELLFESGDAQAAAKEVEDELEPSSQGSGPIKPAVRVAALYFSASPFFKSSLSEVAPDDDGNGSPDPTASSPEMTPLMRAKQSKALLSLMTIASTYGDQFPDMAAAGLHQASLILADESDRERRVIQNEIISQYSKTYHGRLLNSSTEIR